MLRAWALAAALTLAGGAAALAQDTRVLVVDIDRMLNTSRFGQAFLADLEAAREALLAENTQIEADLIAEESALTEQRATLSPEEFRPLAEAFDAKVTALRAGQDEKARALTQEFENRRQLFFQRVGPILGAIVQERGADVLLEQSATLIRNEAAVITDLAIERIDAELAP